MSTDPRVVHDAEEHVFRLVVDGQVAGYAEYVPSPGAMAVTHVVVEPRFGGRGFGSALAEAALGAAREQGLDVLPYCTFVREHVRRNPEHLDLVPAEHRGAFGLAGVG